jgi:3-deoxy-manno-octulosonate cytidylyltransferase (CMP-KDO synthetase)
MREIKDEKSNNLITSKVVTDQNGFALYFRVLSYPREKDVGVRYAAHHGIYAFRKQALLDFIVCPEIIRSIRKLEQLRYLEFGKRISKWLKLHRYWNR